MYGISQVWNPRLLVRLFLKPSSLNNVRLWLRPKKTFEQVIYISSCFLPHYSFKWDNFFFTDHLGSQPRNNSFILVAHVLPGEVGRFCLCQDKIYPIPPIGLFPLFFLTPLLPHWWLTCSQLSVVPHKQLEDHWLLPSSYANSQSSILQECSSVNGWSVHKSK